MAYIQVGQVITPETTLEEIRDFVKLTERADGKSTVADYEENGDLIGIMAIMTPEEFNPKE